MTVTTDFRPVVRAVRRVPAVYPEQMEPQTDSDGEPVAGVYSDGEDRAVLLTDDLRPRIISTEADEGN